jgi:hypothetical protein
MKKELPKTDSLKEEMDTDVPQNPDIDFIQPDLKSKRRRPKRDGCGGGLPGNASTSLPGSALVSLPGAMATGLAGKPGTGLPPGDIPPDFVKVIRVKQSIRRGAEIKATDVEEYIISKSVSTPDMPRSFEQVVGKAASQNIPANKILTKNLLK